MRTKFVVKASLFTLILALVAIGTIALAEVMKKGQPVGEERAVVMDTWYFQGGDPRSADSYSNDPNDEIPCTTPLQTICQIEAPADGNLPDFSAEIDGKTVSQHVSEAMEALEEDDPLLYNSVIKEYRSNN